MVKADEDARPRTYEVDAPEGPVDEIVRCRKTGIEEDDGGDEDGVGVGKPGVSVVSL